MNLPVDYALNGNVDDLLLVSIRLILVVCLAIAAISIIEELLGNSVEGGHRK